LAASRTLVGLTTSSEGRDGLLRGLDQVLKGDAALRAQLASLLAKQLHAHPTVAAATPRRSATESRHCSALYITSCNICSPSGRSRGRYDFGIYEGAGPVSHISRVAFKG
jgi:hypothetical protein